MQVIYGLRYKDTGELAGIDSNSGGYPYRASLLFGAKLFSSRENAEHFMRPNDFGHPSYPELEIVEIHYSIESL